METINLENEYIDLSTKKTTQLNVKVKGINEITIFSNISFLNIALEDNALLVINHFNNISGELTINLEVQNNACLTYNLSEKIAGNNNINMALNFLGNNSQINTNIHTLVSGKEHIKIDGIVKNNKKDNSMLESVKALLIEEGSCQVEPNMLIDTNLITANHKVGISSLNDKYLFYLNGKGLSKEASIKLIKKSFLLSNLTNDELKEKINDII